MVYGTHRDYKGADGYAGNTFRDLDLAVTSAVRSLKEHRDDFDFIVVTGVSGLSVGAPVALKLKKRLLVLRKQTEDCHSAPGDLLGGCDLDADSRVLFFDDFVSGGKTRSRCIAAVLAATGRVVGQYEYTHDLYQLFEPDDVAELVNP